MFSTVCLQTKPLYILVDSISLKNWLVEALLRQRRQYFGNCYIGGRFLKLNSFKKIKRGLALDLS